LPSHGRGHWFDPSTAPSRNKIFQQLSRVNSLEFGTVSLLTEQVPRLLPATPDARAAQERPPLTLTHVLTRESPPRQPRDHDLRVLWNEPLGKRGVSVISAFRHNELVPRIRIDLDRDIAISGARQVFA